MGSPGKRKRVDDIDRAATQMVGMVGEGQVEGDLMQPAPSSAKEKMNGEPWGGIVSVTMTSTVRRKDRWAWLTRRGGGGNEAASTVDGKKKMNGEPREAQAW
eukprot:jgi/Undpi1/931/HiC_scaffold_10.g04395.m1